jgi:hypothetical protein
VPAKEPKREFKAAMPLFCTNLVWLSIGPFMGRAAWALETWTPPTTLQD